MQRLFKHLCLVAILCSHSKAYSWGMALRFGPPAIGRGGANPVSIPPQVIDTQVAIASNSGFEGNFSVTGLYLGQRYTSQWGGYVTLGGGLVISSNGVGPGAYTAFGMDWGCPTLCFSMEYLRALGIGAQGLVQPYAFRIGAALWFK